MSDLQEQYRAWIGGYVKLLNGMVAGHCAAAAEQMKAGFPELRVARGYVQDCFGAEHQHWWCVDPNGQVQDPTAVQFQGGVMGYEEYNEKLHGPLPIGKCMDCGSVIYGCDQPEGYSCSAFCNPDCEERTRVFYGW